MSAPGLDADRILLVRDDHRMDYYAGSRWVAPIPQMVEDLAAETLRNSGVWSSVHDSQGAFPTDYFLQLDIRRFEADYTESVEPTVHVVLDCTLGRRTDRELLSEFRREGERRRGGQSPERRGRRVRIGDAIRARHHSRAEPARAQNVDSPVDSMKRYSQ